ncbi:LysR family transcriptional regulator [Tropicibacter sp. Alg240-R139]|uniref:LysR family transcriptional regulator n=1 Tax=Tropicibacter sp. Alg240-R139 TaxID=2305991 RepID=UPI0013DEE211|nr:LysR family transcriptional regulator [Tropicibacter sp. Alg240-R139]
MSWRNMPSLISLRALDAFAVEGNVVKAGQILNVSHAAISQHLKQLEAHLGVSLVDRNGRSLVLTVEGQQLARALRLGFGAITAAVEELMQIDAARPLHISCTSTFATIWLMPRLPDFRVKHPEIDLMLDPNPRIVALEPGGVDMAIRHGDGNWPGLNVEMLVPSAMSVVASPALLGGRQSVTPEELAELPWLEEIGANEANTWFESHGVELLSRGARIQLPGNLLIEGVRAGQGVAVTVRKFVEDDLASGRLVELFCDESARGYFIVTRPGVLRPPVKAFLQWLRRQKTQEML